MDFLDNKIRVFLLGSTSKSALIALTIRLLSLKKNHSCMLHICWWWCKVHYLHLSSLIFPLTRRFRRKKSQTKIQRETDSTEEWCDAMCVWYVCKDWKKSTKKEAMNLDFYTVYVAVLGFSFCFKKVPFSSGVVCGAVSSLVKQCSNLMQHS